MHLKSWDHRRVLHHLGQSAEALNFHEKRGYRQRLVLRVILANGETDQVKTRGSPRKAQPPAKAAAICQADAGSKARCRTSSKSDTGAIGSDDPKTLRLPDKNRLAADKCRSRRRQEEDNLKSQHLNLKPI
ncbi:transcriptional regulator family: bZIP [Purpureocillium lilacinum]|uniref:Transcriptional regulator family: bZIP n=1 Tax=Purpureocillium lilacinum TaxID=33203 RepID=A0ABR0BDP3_PURLI|nr:transcriptional regulator family: bZIP [Purpureocillium lilacinum]